eukprot:3325804-Amphidinium_carterae.1
MALAVKDVVLPTRAVTGPIGPRQNLVEEVNFRNCTTSGSNSRCNLSYLSEEPTVIVRNLLELTLTRTSTRLERAAMV